MPNLLQQSQNLQKEAQKIIETLQLFPLWEGFGCKPYLVGALAYGLALAPDIDIEVICQEPKISNGFEVLKACALQPGCWAVRFINKMAGPDMGYYWQLRYEAQTGVQWKIDMWSMHVDHPGPTSQNMVKPMLKVLNKKKKLAILELKQSIRENSWLKCPSIYLYQAVITDNVQTMEELEFWLKGRDLNAINDWREWLI
jgi:hypothetical protein